MAASRNSPQGSSSCGPEEARLLRTLRGLLAIRNVDARLGRHTSYGSALVRETRRQIRDSIQKIRAERADSRTASQPRVDMSLPGPWGRARP